MAGGTHAAPEDDAVALRAEFRRILGAQTPEDLLCSLSAEELREMMAEARFRQKQKKTQAEVKAGFRPAPRPLAEASASLQLHLGPAPKGLTNLGNTCYLSSVLQCLAQTQPFTRELEALENGLGSIGGALCGVLQDVRSPEPEQTASVESILSKLATRYPWYEGKAQQDAHELLRTLLGALTDEEQSKVDGRTSQQAVQSSFQGHVCEAILCWGCKKISLRQEIFLDLSVDIPSAEDRGPLGLPSWAMQPLQVAEEVEGAAAEDEEPGEENNEAGDIAQAAFQVVLERVPGRRIALGLEWADANLFGHKVLRKVAPSSLAETWNRRQPKERLLVPGLALLSVNGKDDNDEIMQVLKDERRMELRFVPEAVMKASRAKTDHDKSSDSRGFTVELCRDAGSKMPWGFQLDQTAIKEGVLMVASIDMDSLLDSWNLRCRSTGRQNQVVCAGDRVLEVNGSEDIEDMQMALRNVSRRKNLVRLEHGDRKASQNEDAGKKDSGDDAKYEVELEPRHTGPTASWGLEWEEVNAMDELPVKCVTPGSVVAMWNIRCLSRGDEHLCVEPGDCLVSQSDTSGTKTFVFRRTKERQAACRAMAGTAVSELKATGSEALEQRRRKILQRAEACAAELPTEVGVMFQAKRPDGSSTEGLSLTHCLQHLGAAEALEDGFEPIYECANCKKKQQGKTFASKRGWLESPLPPVLPVQLKRFRCQKGTTSKTQTRVQTSTYIDLTALLLSEDERRQLELHLNPSAMPRPAPEPQAASESMAYELYAVCAHLGASMERGHYVAFVNMGPNLQEEAWYLLDDARVTPCQREDALQVEAYIAFYRRVKVAH